MSDPHTKHYPHQYQVSTKPSIDTDHPGQTVIQDLEPILERLTTLFMALDHSWRVTYLSHLSDPLLAQARTALLGKTLWEILPKAVDSPFFHKYHSALEASLPIHCEEFYPPLHKWFEVHISPSPEGWEVYVQGITERKELQGRIWQSEQQLQAIIDGSPACIYVRDIQERFTHVNQQSANVLHITKEQMLGRTPAELFPREIAETWQMHDREILSTGRAGEWEEVDGLHTFLSVKFPLFDASGVPYAVCGISTDISERKLGQRKDEFISMASHELRTPLTSLLAYTDLLRLLLEEDGSQPAIHYVSKMDAQLEKLTRLIADLLDISKVQAGKLTYAEELVAIDDLVREVVENIQLTTPQHCIIIEGGAICEVIGDRERLGQVVINLLSNAVKYSPQAEKVVVSIARTPDEVTIRVRDFGIGIPAHDQERIFERFYRGSSNVQKQFPGLGIGLYIAHHIIQNHGGRIWVESGEGQGSTFSFALPLERV